MELVKRPGHLDRFVSEITAVDAGEFGRPARTYLFQAPGFGRRSTPTGYLPDDIDDYEAAGFD